MSATPSKAEVLARAGGLLLAMTIMILGVTRLESGVSQAVAVVIGAAVVVVSHLIANYLFRERA
jgi:hypothetical protein